MNDASSSCGHSNKNQNRAKAVDGFNENKKNKIDNQINADVF